MHINAYTCTFILLHYIIRCLHIPKEPLQPQHDLDWHRDVINTIKPKHIKDMLLDSDDNLLYDSDVIPFDFI